MLHKAAASPREPFRASTETAERDHCFKSCEKQWSCQHQEWLKPNIRRVIHTSSKAVGQLVYSIPKDRLSPDLISQRVEQGGIPHVMDT